MIIVATVCLSLRAPLSESPVYLSAVGVFATLLGLISGFGFCLLIGIPICALVFVTPFLIIGLSFPLEMVSMDIVVFLLLLGVGTDDMFLIYSAYRRTKTSDSTAGRMGETFRLCGSGITITSLTNVVAFLAGATTNFYGIRLFCFYTSEKIVLPSLFRSVSSNEFRRVDRLLLHLSNYAVRQRRGHSQRMYHTKSSYVEFASVGSLHFVQ